MQGLGSDGRSAFLTPRDVSATPDSNVTRGSAEATGREQQLDTTSELQRSFQYLTPRQQQSILSFCRPFTPSMSVPRGELHSSIGSRSTSPVVVRPTKDLPPTKDAVDAPRMPPTAVKREESVFHDGDGQTPVTSVHSSVVATQSASEAVKLRPPKIPASSPSPSPSPKAAVANASATSATTTTAGLATTATGADVSAEAAGSDAAPQGTVYNVCSLCGLTVLLGGSFAEQQQQWQDHINSWMHQRCLKMHANARNENVYIGDTTTVSIGSPVSPSMLKALEEFSSSIASSDAGQSAGRAIRLSPAPLKLPVSDDVVTARELEARRITFSSEDITPRILADSSEHLSLVEKKLFTSVKKPHVSGDDAEVVGILTDEREAATAGKATCEGGAPPICQKRKLLKSVKESGETPIRGGFRKLDVNADQVNTSSGAEMDDAGQKNSSKRHLKRRLDKYLVVKERRLLLACMRHWFNSMFVRVTDNFFSVRSRSSKETLDAMVAASPTVRCSRTDTPLDAYVPGVGQQKASPLVRKGSKKQPELVAVEAAAGGGDNEKGELLFMASRVKDFAHIKKDSSADSLEMEVGKTDVKWYVSRPAGNSRKRGKVSSCKQKKDGSSTPSLEDDSSIEELLSSLAPPLQERVRMAIRGKPVRKSKFPMTSEVISMMRDSVQQEVQQYRDQQLFHQFQHQQQQQQHQHREQYHDNYQHHPVASRSSPDAVGIPQQPFLERREFGTNTKELVNESLRIREGEVGSTSFRREQAIDTSVPYGYLSQILSEETPMRTTGLTEGVAPNKEDERGGKILANAMEEASGVVGRQLPRPFLLVEGRRQLSGGSSGSSECGSAIEERGDEAPRPRSNGSPDDCMRYLNTEASFSGSRGISRDRKHRRRRSRAVEAAESEIREPRQISQSHITNHARRGASCKGRQPLSISSIHSTLRAGGNSERPTSPQTTPRVRGTSGSRASFTVRKGSMEEWDTSSCTFRGVPGEYYCYDGETYQHVEDPTAGALCDKLGRPLPLYFVRRCSSPSMSPTRFSCMPVTRSRSPLGPGRLNPYCSVCVERYNIVMVDENMRVLSPVVNRRGGGTGNCACTFANRGNSASGRGRGKRRCSSASNTFSPHRGISPGGCVETTDIGKRKRGSIALPTGKHHRIVDLEALSSEQVWLLQQERRVRSMIKALLRHEFPVNEKCRQWVAYLNSLNDAAEALKTLQVVDLTDK